MLKHLKSYLEISNFERRGIFALLFVFILVSGYYYFSNTIGESAPDIDQEMIANFQTQINSSIKEPKAFNIEETRGRAEIKKQVRLLPFDPNLDSFKELLKKGVPYAAVKTMVNYRNKGGVFRQKEDIKKLYSVDDELFEKLRPYIQMSDQTANLKNNSSPDRIVDTLLVKDVVLVDVNSATLEELQTVSGIGVFYAKTILEQRAKLGGFYSSEQLREVYGMTDEAIMKITPQLVFSPNGIKKLAVNTKEYEEIAKHPYLSYKEARAIVNYRKQHGAFTDVKQIKSLHIFRGKDISKLLPYLDLN